MANPVKRIEKDYLLKVIYDEQLPLVYFRNRSEYRFILEKPARDELFLRANRLIPGLKKRKKINLIFDCRWQTVSFSTEILSIRDRYIKSSVPEVLYKNLDRSYSRVTVPPDLQVQFTFLEDRYSLSYPQITEYTKGEPGNFMKQLDFRNLSGLIDQMAAWVKGCASGHKLVIFKDLKPSSTEERLIAETGKILYLPQTQSGFPLEDPYPRKRLIVADIFKRYLESTGAASNYVDEACERFTKTKYEEGITSDAWVPILFQEYVVGYIHIWVNKNDGHSQFDYGVIDTLYQFAKILSFSLKANGYFEAGLMKNDPFEGKVIDVSASGLLFAYPHSTLASVLLPDSELAVKLITPGREIDVNALIVRRYKDPALGYFGCQFSDIDPEDLRFFFSFIYGRPFTEADARFLAGQV